ncbi:MAG TPA: glycosyltransferase family 2 protein [Chitinophagaceae bacterium]|nr:glycosyltransferase family 2 protein [Chitinophagaceae bacterium]
MNQPFISICIPAYKRTDFLQRLLDSIAIQTFMDFEVVVTDDSPSEEVQGLCRQFEDKFPLHYKKNAVVLGTPENWNESIRQAKGKWIKIMHDDDWFSTASALEKFFAVAQKEKGAVIFSSYNDFFLSSGKQRRIIIPALRFRQLKKEPVTLLSRNIIGPPSVIMHKNDGKHWYDPRVKWLVDIDMYIRRLQDDRIVYLPDALINVGIGEEQVTASMHNDPEVQIPEHFYFLEKTGIRRLTNILVYDYWWRFFRNFSLLSPDDILKFGYNGVVHPVMQSMMSWQKKLPRFMLKTGILSKMMMFIHFCLHRKKLAV